MEFFVKGHARLRRFEASYKGSGGGDKTYAGYEPNITTAGYLVHTSPVQLPGGRMGPQLLASFGMSGTISLVFAHVLRKAAIPVKVQSTTKTTYKPRAFAWDLLSTVLREPGIGMVEITINNKIPTTFYNLDFADDWKYELVAPCSL
jgi:hypothetical protein